MRSQPRPPAPPPSPSRSSAVDARRGVEQLRVLVLCADIGEGHVTVARALAAELAERPGVAQVELRTSLDVLGRRLGRFLANGFRVHLEQIGWTYELAYRVFARWAPGRRVGERALAVLGGRALVATIAQFGAHVVVVEYPVISAALGELRRTGMLDVPVCSSISDPAGLHYWAHPGIDLHLLSWPESMQGGGWGLGDLDAAIRAALDHGPATFVVALTGHNASVRAALERTFGSEPRVRVLGFTDQMPALLAAADALVHTTGGTTALEARIVGCPLVNFDTAVAHVRTQAATMARLGLAEHAPDRATLSPALARTLARPRPAPLDVTGLPSAAAAVVQLVSDGP